MPKFRSVGANLLLLLFTISPLMVVRAQVKSADEPEVIAAVAPIFPIIAAAAKADGDVVVEVKINSRGMVTSSSAVVGHPLLRAVCEVASRRWKFVPSNDGSKERSVRLTFSFRILEKDAPEIETTPVFMPPYRVEVTRGKPVIQTVTVQ
ncbi:MAG: energy transducer TonB [Pyrinomonadaceae bacterium]